MVPDKLLTQCQFTGILGSRDDIRRRIEVARAEPTLDGSPMKVFQGFEFALVKVYPCSR